MHIPCEADLASDDHNKLAAALTRCTGYSPDCMNTKRCELGSCFEPESKELKRIADLEAQLEALQVKQSRFEATIESHIAILSASYKSKLNAKNESGRWALHFAKQKFLELQKELKGE